MLVEGGNREPPTQGTQGKAGTAPVQPTACDGRGAQIGEAAAGGHPWRRSACRGARRVRRANATRRRDWNYPRAPGSWNAAGAKGGAKSAMRRHAAVATRGWRSGLRLYNGLYMYQLGILGPATAPAWCSRGPSRGCRVPRQATALAYRTQVSPMDGWVSPPGCRSWMQKAMSIATGSASVASLLRLK